MRCVQSTSTYRVQGTVLEGADVAMNDGFLISTAESLTASPHTNMNFQSFSILLFVSLRCSPTV